MGLMMSDEILNFSEFEHYTHFLQGANGRMLEIPLRRGVGDSAFIDQITFSFHERSIDLVQAFRVFLMMIIWFVYL